jgi:hypothetical protein
MSPGEAGRIILLDLSTDEDTVLVEPGFDAHYLESGHLIHGGCDGQVRAALFDPESSEIVEPVDPSWSVPKRATSAMRASRGMAATSHSPVMGMHGLKRLVSN